MISSRCKTKIKDDSDKISLSDIRKGIVEVLQSETLFDTNIYQVWVSEDPRDTSALESSWEECMSQVDKADILLCIYTGEGGWAKEKGDIGICQGEMETGINKEPAKVFIINAEKAIASKINKTDPVNKRMKEYVLKINRFYNEAFSKEDIINIAKEIIGQATINLAKLGKSVARRGKYNFGEALDWSRMNFAERKFSIENEITKQFLQSGSTETDKCIVYTLYRKKYLFKIHGIPSGMSVSAAREMVGQPFLKDYKLTFNLKKKVFGPVHIIGVHKGVTEQQAINILGQPDAIIVNGPYGIYIADKIQNIQMIFLDNCRDSASTRHNVQKFVNWLDESGESDSFFMRAERRSQILDVINKQQKSSYRDRDTHR